MKYISLILLLFPCMALAEGGTCVESSDLECINSLLGNIIIKSNSSTDMGFSSLTLNGEVLFRVRSDEMMTSNGQDEIDDAIKTNGQYLTRKTIIKYWESEPCHCEKFFMLDLSGKKPVISNEFFDSASSYIDWVSWGDKRSVISLAGKKYRYENGKVTPVEDKE